MTPTPPGDRDADVSEIRIFLLTDSDVLAQEGASSLWRSVVRPVEDAPAGPTPAQLRNLKRMHPAYQGRLSRADGPAKTPAPVHAGRTQKMEIYDPLTSSWSAVPPGAGPAKVGDAVCIVPTVNPDAVTPHSEAFQAVIWHLLVSHPALKLKQTKWEGVGSAPANA